MVITNSSKGGQFSGAANTALESVFVDILGQIRILESQTNNDAIVTAADRVQTGLDVLATNADVLLTNADVLLTIANAALTAADRVQTGLDAAATAADRVQTALDALSIAADAVIAGTRADEASVSASNALASSIVVNAYGNIDWAGFAVSDGDLIIDFFDNADSVPSLVDGELILTY